AKGGPSPAAGKPAAKGMSARTTTAPPAAPAERSVRARVVARLGAAASWAGGGLPLTTLIISVLGVADASYLTYQHFSQATAFAGCSDKGTVNCEAVTTSAWSHFLGMPVSVLGLAFFLFMLVLCSPWGWRAPWPAVHWARLGAVIIGMVFVLYLVW